jgi:hypothetical protein
MAASKSTARAGDLPTVSRVFDDRTLVELLYDADTRTTALAVAHPDGTISIEERFAAPTGEWLIPYSADNNLLTSGCVLLPSTVGEEMDKGDLLAAIRSYLHRYVDLSPLFEEIAAHYVLMTWVYDAFSELPYLRFSGAFGAGKTRCLLILGSICHKPFFASGASTVSPIFHILDAFQGTLILDEADFRFSDATLVLGGLIVSTLGLAAFSRAGLPPQARRPFHLYVDEFQSFTTLSFVNMMSELRKYGVGLTLANQYLNQLDTDLRHAVLGNIGTLISFRVGPEDALVLEREFQPTFGVEDLLNLANRDLYLKLMIDGTPSKPFSARTLSCDEVAS